MGGYSLKKPTRYEKNPPPTNWMQNILSKKLQSSQFNRPFYRWFSHYICTSSLPCWWMKTDDLALAPFVGPPVIIINTLHYIIVVSVSRDWSQTIYCIQKVAVNE